MRRKALFTLLIVSVVLNAAAQLPVLRVSFKGSLVSSKEYLQGNMSLTDTDGSVIDLPAKFKSRGATAKQYTMKPSFNMKLRDADGTEIDSTLCGLRSASSWILDAMAVDRICMRNRVAFDIWNEFSKLPYETQFDSRNGTVGKFVEVYINNKYYGIYCLTDRINRKLLDLKKPQVEEDGTYIVRGVIYKHGTNNIDVQEKADTFSEDSVTLVIGYHDAWELTEPEDYGGMQAWGPLYELYRHHTDYAFVKEHFYLDNLAEYQIFIMALGIADNWGNKNSYLSARNIQADGNKRRFVYTPWDLDTSLGGGPKGEYYDGKYNEFFKVADIPSISTMPIPFGTCNSQAEFKELLKEKWKYGRKNALAVTSVKNKLYAYRDLLIDSGAWKKSCDYWKTQKYPPCYVEDLAKEIDYIVEWYRQRFAEMDSYFGIDPSGIEEHQFMPSDDAYYDLNGRKVGQPQHGVYIHHKRKVLFYE